MTSDHCVRTWSTFSAAVVTALLVGCYGSQSVGPKISSEDARGISAATQYGRSWILPEAKSEDLIYAVGGCSGTCILSYPKGNLVGAIYGYQGNGLSADCSDKDGNVYISNNSEVVEFQHGGTSPIATFHLPAGSAAGCAIDPSSGSLAVVFNFGSIAIFEQGSSTPSVYDSLLDAVYCGYDKTGDLFVDGVIFDSGIKYGLSELSSGSSEFKKLTLDQSVGLPGQIQWDGQYVTYESASPGQFTISQLSVSGSSVTVVSQTRLKRVRNRLDQSWIYRGSIVAPYSDQGPHARNIGIWKYPGGGTPTNRITRFGSFDKRDFGFYGTTVSVAK